MALPLNSNCGLTLDDVVRSIPPATDEQISNTCSCCEQSTESSESASIQCEICKRWLHYSCTKLPAYQLSTLVREECEIFTYWCEKCSMLDDYVIDILESKRGQVTENGNEESLKDQLKEKTKALDSKHK